jgi:hypothetical protein
MFIICSCSSSSSSSRAVSERRGLMMPKTSEVSRNQKFKETERKNTSYKPYKENKQAKKNNKHLKVKR